MDEQLFDQQLAAWLRDGPTSASSWVLDGIVNHARTHPRRTPIHVRWGSAMKAVDAQRRPASFTVRPLIVLATLAIAIALGGLVYIGARGLLVAPPSPTALISPAPVSTSTPLGTATSTSTPAPTTTSTPAPGPTATIGFACPTGSDPNTPGPADQKRPWTGAGWPGIAGPMTFDSAHGVVVALNGSPLSLWQFDVCTNTWAQSELAVMSEETPQLLVYDPTTDQLLADEGATTPAAPAAHTDTRLVSFDLETGARTVKAAMPFDESLSRVYAVLRPSAGQLVVRDDTKSLLWSYDVSSDTWAELGQAGDVPPAMGSVALLAYDPSVDRLVLYSRNDWVPAWYPRTYEYDFETSTWTREADPPEVDLPGVMPPGYVMAYDEALGRVVIFSHYDGYTYDAANDQWDILDLHYGSAGSAHPTYGDSLVYDSANARLVVFDGWDKARGVLAIDPVTHWWRTLLGQVTQ